MSTDENTTMTPNVKMTVTPHHQQVDRDGAALVAFVAELHPQVRPLPVALQVEPMWFHSAADGRFYNDTTWAVWLSGWAANRENPLSFTLDGPAAIRIAITLPEEAAVGTYYLRLVAAPHPASDTDAELSAFISFTIHARRRQIASLLPDIFQRTYGRSPNVLSAYLGVMDQLHAPAEAILAHLDNYIDPEKTPDAFMPFLAGWVNMDSLLEADGTYLAGMDRLRNLVQAAIMLAKWRGTRQGLVKFLEIATGIPGYQIAESDQQAFHIIVTCPNEAAALKPLVIKIVEREKPAYVTYELRFHAQVNPTTRGRQAVPI